MRLQFFSIPALDPEASTRELNDFLAKHRILEVEKCFVANGGYWAVCVSFGESSAKAEPKPRIDYKQLLDPATFTVFSRLRENRKVLAEQDGVPVYAVFTNEHLAEMARQRMSTLAELRALPGVGEAKVSRYGNAMLKVLSALNVKIAKT